MTVCNRIIQQPSVFTNNTYVNNFYNRQTNINQTFINKDNAQLSISNNITVNNYGVFGRKQGLGTVKPGFGQKIGNFLCGYRQPVQRGCGCQKQVAYKHPLRPFFHQPVQRFCSSIAGKLRGFMNFRYGNV